MLVLLPCLALAQAAAPRIGYVDMKRLLDEAPQVQQAQKQLQQEFAARDASLKAAQQRLDALTDKLRTDRPTLDPSEIEARQRTIDTLAGSVRRARSKMQQALKSRSDQALQRSWQTISDAAVEYARSHGYDLLLPSPVIYASPKVDITDAILDRLRREYAKDHPQ
ncbi:MAG TPA: OmpH family outer membrane protein [Rhodanobacteraceae bacterium]|nr:OmpH family outer membrane protein [Rhodanobacteraceae bacterium]